MQAYAPTGEQVGDRVELAKVRLHAETQGAYSEEMRSAPLVTWQDGISLTAADLELGPGGFPAAISLAWTADQPIQRDYTVSVQVLDAEDQMLAQVDRPPLDGQFPTSTWRAGELIPDMVRWDGKPSLDRWRRVLVTMYGADGQRVPTVSGGGSKLGVLPGSATILPDGLEIRRIE